MEKKTYRWVDDLQNFSRAINNTVNRSTGFAPNSINSTNWRTVFDKLYKSKHFDNVICKFSVGDRVRIPLELPKKYETFRKGVLAKWSKEIYTIRKAYQSGAVCYFKLNRDSSVKKRYYYEEELNLVARVR